VGTNTERMVLATMRTTLRKWEYYGLTDTFTELYNKSKSGEIFSRLYDLIVDEKNILLAYRTIKNNKGSETAGTDEIIIDNYKSMTKDDFIKLVRKTLVNYKPKPVRRVFIPKPNGDKRPLGIPTMLDRLIQQMFKQILEPIAEAKFHKHSYGFRPIRSTHHAISRCNFLIWKNGLHYVVDVDIRGFFDNVNHTKLLKQLWNLGIRDRKVLAVINKMLKAPIDKEGVPLKGTPQGGILSPLLANIVLHDLDMWVASQWEEHPTKYSYSATNHKYHALKKTNLKEGFIVRYADDFKIFTRDWKSAYKWFHAVKQYLKMRLGLDISPEKSKVINLRKKATEFLGYTIKAVRNRNIHTSRSSIKKKKIEAIKKQAKNLLLVIRKSPIRDNITKWNSFVLGIQRFPVLKHQFHHRLTALSGQRTIIVLRHGFKQGI
jgi:RNA-directed DNA polymerase